MEQARENRLNRTAPNPYPGLAQGGGYQGNGAGGRNRTHGILLTRQALYQLSYTGLLTP